MKSSIKYNSTCFFLGLAAADDAVYGVPQLSEVYTGASSLDIGGEGYDFIM
jgi:hypothetical protein